MTTDRSILLLGSGYVAQPCAEYVLRRPDNRRLTIACRRVENAQILVATLADQRVHAVSCDVTNPVELEALVSQHDVTISLVPYIHHVAVIKAAIKCKKHVVTTSYVSPAMAALDAECRQAGITVMNEIGLDPGIDHLYAVKKIQEVHAAGGKMLEFVSYCGGLPAPECSNNPFGYKLSWSCRGVLLALRNAAKIVRGGRHVDIAGPELMKSARPISTGFKGFNIVGYPNRDSTPYNERYSIPEAQTVIRGTLRYAGFPVFIQSLVDIGFLDESPREWLASSPSVPPLTWRQLTCRLVDLDKSGKASDADILSALSNKGKLSQYSDVERDDILFGFRWLGLLSQQAVEMRGTVLDVLCASLESKLAYGPGERDMVLLQHRFTIQKSDGVVETHLSTLLEYGKPNGTTAMAKTVGVPCGIAVQLVLDGRLLKRGIVAPMTMDICAPLIELVEKEGIGMVEEIIA